MRRNPCGHHEVNLQSFNLRRADSSPAFGDGVSDELAVSAQVVLDSSPNPTFIMQSDGKIIHRNAASVALLRSQGALRAINGHLTLHRMAENRSLLEAAQSATTDGVTSLLRLFSRPGEPALLVRVMPTSWPNLVVICIAELREKLRMPSGWSRMAFGFTPTIAALAEALADGVSLAEFAECNAVPIGTVRTRLKKLLSLTGFSSQAALVASLLRGASVMSDIGASVIESKGAGCKPQTLMPERQTHP